MGLSDSTVDHAYPYSAPLRIDELRGDVSKLETTDPSFPFWNGKSIDKYFVAPKKRS